MQKADGSGHLPVGFVRDSILRYADKRAALVHFLTVKSSPMHHGRQNAIGKKPYDRHRKSGYINCT
jgi:hypothetical protein